jgi:serine/threonine protein kinase/Flp pilus assembly protein TadD
MPARHPMSPVSGARLGPYEVLAPLGTGGMGEVYRAKDTRLGREVAIKVLPEAFAREPDRVARFRREAQLLASLNHPNIAVIYEFDELQGALFLVMELVLGQTLKEMLLERPLSVDEALPVARQIAEALGAAHAKGVLHRDLKPSNVKVTPEKKVKLLDFGLAKAFYSASPSPDISQSPTVPAEQTRQGMVIGTAAYMSPEQARGQTLDARSDVWSFGCVLFEMLTGQKAFEGDTLSDILVAVLERPPDWDALPPATPPAIVELLKLALKKNVNERLKNIADARSVIDGVLGGGPPVVARPRTPSQPVSRSLAEQPGRLLMLTALLALAGVAAWVGMRSRDGRGSLPKEKYLAILPFEDRTGQPGAQLFGIGLAESLSAHLQNVSGLQILPPSSVAPAGDADLTIAKDRGANLIIRGSVRREADKIRVSYFLRSPVSIAQIGAGEVEGTTLEPFALEDSLAKSVLAMLSVQQLAAAPPSLARKGLEGGSAQEDYLKALGALQRNDDAKSVMAAIGLLSKIPDGDDSALVQAALGRASLAQYSLTRDRADAERAKKASERAVTLNASLPEVRVTLGKILTATGHAEEAVEELKRAVEMQPRSGEAVFALAEAQERAGQLGDAETSYRRGIELRPTSWSSANTLGSFFFRQGKYDLALEAYQKAIALNPEAAPLWANVGAIYVRTGRFAKAEEPLRKSIALQPTGLSYSNLGASQYFLGRYADAAASFEEAVHLSPKNFRWLVHLGDAYTWAPGLEAKAKPSYEKAIPLGEAELAVNPRDTMVLTTLARCYARTGQTERAWSYAEKAVALDPAGPDVLKRAAVAAVVLGKRDDAFRLLGRAVSAGYATAEIERDPEFSSLRGDPRFQDVLEKSLSSPKNKS